MAKNPPKKSLKKTDKRVLSSLSSSVIITTTGSIWLLIISFFVLSWLYISLPDVSEKLTPNRRPIVTLISPHGTILAKIGDLYGEPIHYKNFPKNLIQAVLATEDRRFFKHVGIDFFGIGRALWANIKAGRIKQGGSTITQQLAKNLFLKPERSYKRKIQELMLAFWLEYNFSKDQIITLYLNRVYFGSSTYGADAAARKYFGKSVRDVNTWQAALLAGALKAPSRYNPLSNIKLAEKRARLVLMNMVATGYLTQTQAKHIQRKYSNNYKIKKNRLAPYFVDWIMNQIQDYVGRPSRDLIVTTTLDPILQLGAEKAIKSTLLKAKVKTKGAQVSLVSMDPTGAILAMVGGRNYNQSQFNRATQARRQPGSAFKPIVYLSALEMGLTPDTTIVDKPFNSGAWKPKNFDNKYRGLISLNYALENSVNTVAVRLANKVGINRVIQKAKLLGISIKSTEDSSIALGTSEVTPLELTAAYAAFANGGVGVWPHGITEIRDPDGTILYRRHGSKHTAAMSLGNAFTITKMLERVITGGTGRKAVLNRPAAGKTGTSQDFRDAWFVGYTPNLISSVWLGNDNNSPMHNITGGGIPAKIWQKFMLAAHKGVPKAPFRTKTFFYK